MRLYLVFFALSGLSGCFYGELNADNLNCPCASGFVCVQDRCVVPASDPSLRPDAGSNGPLLPDAGINDIPQTLDPVDAGGAVAMDAGVEIDAGLAVDTGVVVPTQCNEFVPNVLCDGFEATRLEWTETATTNGRLSLSSERARFGQQSLKVEVNQPSGVATAFASNLGPFLDGSVFIRQWLYVGGDQTVTNTGLMFFNESQYPFTTVSVNVVGSQHFWMGLTTVEEIVGDVISTRTLDRDRWVCMELEVEIAQAGRLTLYLDGQLASRTPPLDTRAVWDKLGTGANHTADTQPAFTYAIDDFVVTTERFPCPAR